jgi:hypothetical protein
MIDLDAEKKRLKANGRTLRALLFGFVFYVLATVPTLLVSLVTHNWHGALVDGAALLNLLIAAFLLRQAYRTNRGMRDSLFDIEQRALRDGLVFVSPEIEAHCACGAKLIRKDARTWVCPNEPWYTRWLPMKPRHAALQVGMEVRPRIPEEPQQKWTQ